MLSRSVKLIARATFRNYYLRTMYHSNLNKYRFGKHFCYTSSQSTHPTNQHTSQNDDDSTYSSNEKHELNKKTSQHMFNKGNKNENFNDSYVGDVEFKVPSSNLHKNLQQIENEPTPIYPDQSAPTFTSFSDVIANQVKHHKEDDSNKSQSNNDFNTSTSQFSGNLDVAKDHNKNKNVYTNNTEVKTDDANLPDKAESFDQQKKKLMSSHQDLDLSTKDFEKHMKIYEKKFESTKDETKTVENFAPSNENYFLKDNNSEYNKHLGNTDDDKSKAENIQKKDEKNMKDDYSLDKDEDLNFKESYEQNSDDDDKYRSRHL